MRGDRRDKIPAAPDAWDEEELARRATTGDADAWGEVFERHYSSVYGFVRFRLRHAQEAEDVASQVFEVAYTRAGTFDYRGIPIGAWLMGIARNLVRDQLKKRARRGFHEELDDTAVPPEPDATPDVDLQQDIAAAMQDLTEDQQTVLSLRFLLDKPVAETAVLMGRSEDAVKNLQRRALAAMHRSLTRSGYVEGGAE